MTGERSRAIDRGETHYFTGKPCKHGHMALRRIKDRKCMECDKVDKLTFKYVDKERMYAQHIAQYQKHRAKRLAQKKVYREQNRSAIVALATQRKKYIRLRTPAWIDKEERFLIVEAYRLAALRKELTGFAWHVDHKIPLQGELVSGLHVPENIQVIPWIDNIRKRNRYAV